MSSEATAAIAAASSQTGNQVIDEKFAGSMCFVVTLMRALESAREDRIVSDPFAEPLTRKARPTLMPVLESWAKKEQHPSSFMALRTRYLDEALDQRDPNIRQIVLLGAGLDARAYRLESLRGAHVLEIDQSDRIFAHKQQVMDELEAPLIAAKHDCIVADLLEASWEKKLLDSGFDPTIPTFWAMEGLLMYLDRESNITLLQTIDSLSASGSALWADMSGEVMLKQAELKLLKAVDSLKDAEARQGLLSHGEDD
ncbi:hypothetical protein BBJ28_00025301, partial [Nothophytophthora sp. Chile5]